MIAFSNREVLTCGAATMDCPRDSYEFTDRHPVPSLAQAVLVSSQLLDYDDPREATHAPCLDIDHNVVMTSNKDGLPTLWVDRLGYTATVASTEAFAAAGLSADARTDRLGPGISAARLHALFAAEDRIVDGPVVAATARTLGPQSTETFQKLMNAIVVAYGDENPLGVPSRPMDEGCALVEPWPIRLSVPGIALPSTHNNHLYLEHRLPWSVYAGLLEELGATALVENGYVNASLARAGTHLRLPWVSKDDGSYHDRSET